MKSTSCAGFFYFIHESRKAAILVASCFVFPCKKKKKKSCLQMAFSPHCDTHDCLIAILTSHPNTVWQPYQSIKDWWPQSLWVLRYDLKKMHSKTLSNNYSEEFTMQKAWKFDFFKATPANTKTKLLKWTGLFLASNSYCCSRWPVGITKGKPLHFPFHWLIWLNVLAMRKQVMSP